jgi:hypothetical protein
MKVKRMFRKSLAFLMVALMVIQLGGMSFSVSDEGYTEIIIVCDVDCDKSQLIIDLLNAETSTSAFNGIAPASIFCLFGHSMAQTTAVEINHRFWATSPRCRQTTYRVDYCTRSSCNHLVATQLTQIRIICCS